MTNDARNPSRFAASLAGLPASQAWQCAGGHQRDDVHPGLLSNEAQFISRDWVDVAVLAIGVLELVEPPTKEKVDARVPRCDVRRTDEYEATDPDKRFQIAHVLPSILDVFDDLHTQDNVEDTPMAFDEPRYIAGVVEVDPNEWRACLEGVAVNVDGEHVSADIG